MLATNVFRKYSGKWFLVHHHASQASVRSSGIDDLLQGPASGAKGIIRIDGTMSQGSGNAQDIVDEIVRALQGALEEDNKGSMSNSIDIGQAGLGGLTVGGIYIDEEDNSEVVALPFCPLPQLFPGPGLGELKVPA